jgi:hypothetical protein
MAFAGYVLQYRGGVSKQRYHDYMAGLLNEWEIVVLYQDMLEADVLPLRMMDGALHLIQMGLCRLHEQQTPQ